MATNDDPASDIMSASELKPLLVLSKRQAVSCAVGMTRDKQAIVLLHRRTKPRKLLAELRKKASSAGVALDVTSLRFGRASVDGGSDSTMVTFTVNKPAPGPLRMKLLERLRPAGFQRCEIVVDEALENEGEDDAGGDAEVGPVNGAALNPSARSGGSVAGSAASSAPLRAGGPAAVSDDAGAGPTAGEPAMPGRPASSGADALRGELTSLVRQIAPVIAADPSQKESLLKLANDANDQRKAGDTVGAAAGIAALRRALPPPSSTLIAPVHGAEENSRPSGASKPLPVLGFLAPAAPALVEGGGAALLAGGAGTGLLAGGAVGGMLLGPQIELQAMAAQAKTNAFWAAYRELGKIDPTNRDAAPFVTNPAWRPSDADVRRVEAALADAKAAKACTADNPTGTRAAQTSQAPASSAPSQASAGQNTGRLPPGPPANVRQDGECDEESNLGPTSSRRRLPNPGTGSWQNADGSSGRAGNSLWFSNNSDVQEITGSRGIPFINGRPNFTPWAKMSINLPYGELTGNNDLDFTKVYEAMSRADPERFPTSRDAQRYTKQNDLTPHHATDTCMQLVPSTLNNSLPHIGSASGMRAYPPSTGNQESQP